MVDRQLDLVVEPVARLHADERVVAVADRGHVKAVQVQVGRCGQLVDEAYLKAVAGLQVPGGTGQLIVVGQDACGSAGHLDVALSSPQLDPEQAVLTAKRAGLTEGGRVRCDRTTRPREPHALKRRGAGQADACLLYTSPSPRDRQ